MSSTAEDRQPSPPGPTQWRFGLNPTLPGQHGRLGVCSLRKPSRDYRELEKWQGGTLARKEGC